MEKEKENLEKKINEIEIENKQLKLFNYKDFDNKKEIRTYKKFRKRKKRRFILFKKS